MGFGAVPLLGPYLIGGVGYYQLHSEGTFGGASFSDSQSEPGGSIGAGIRFGLGGFGVFAETGYHFIKSPGGAGSSATTLFPSCSASRSKAGGAYLVPCTDVRGMAS